ncbi:hypothetical protein, partial [Pseudomonas sp. xss_2]|uniref:hypothetical protein n=1 Tax=Pseudomonas sp. xss_2 TaxID=3367215 RepID=UPI00370AE801
MGELDLWTSEALPDARAVIGAVGSWSKQESVALAITRRALGGDRVKIILGFVVVGFEVGCVYPFAMETLNHLSAFTAGHFLANAPKSNQKRLRSTIRPYAA